MRWTKKEIEFLIKNYPIMGKVWCAKKLKRTEPSIRAKTSELKLKQSRNSEFFINWQKRAAKSKIGKKRPLHSELMKKYANDGRLPQLTHKRTMEEKLLVKNRSSEWIKKNGHPRGFLGHKRTEEQKRQISENSKKMWMDKDFKLNSEEYRQQLSDRMSKQINDRLKNNPHSIYSNSKKGMITIADKKFFARSGWEANIGAYLQFLKENKEIYDYEHEPETFWFNEIKRGTRSYLPDFKIINNDKSIYYIEVKGYMDKKSKTKLYRMNKYYPEIKIDLIDEKRYKEISKSRALFKYWGLLG